MKTHSIYSFSANPFAFDCVELELWAHIISALESFEVRS